MNNKSYYISTGQSPFDSWRIWFYLSIFLGIFFYIRDINLLVNYFVSSFFILTILTFILTVARVSKISKINNDLSCKSLFKSTYISDINKIETWWSYDFNESDIEIGDETQGHTQELINYIYIYTKIEGSNGSVILYELLQLSSKFPKNHKYDQSVDINGIDKYKIWDIDKCLDKLQLSI